MPLPRPPCPEPVPLSTRRVPGLGLLLALLLAGCASPGRPPPPAEASNCHTQTGQAIWQARPGAPALAGELVLARRPDGDFLVQFSKPPLTLVEASRTSNRWRVVFPGSGRQFHGTGGGPARLLWLWLPAGLDGVPLPVRMSFHPTGEGWRLINTHTGESLEGYLVP